MSQPEPESMTPRRALSMALMACQYIADTEAPDIDDWQAAACVIRSMLSQERGAQPATWFTSAKTRARHCGGQERRGNGRG